MCLLTTLNTTSQYIIEKSGLIYPSKPVFLSRHEVKKSWKKQAVIKCWWIILLGLPQKHTLNLGKALWNQLWVVVTYFFVQWKCKWYSINATKGGYPISRVPSLWYNVCFNETALNIKWKLTPHLSDNCTNIKNKKYIYTF